MARPRKYANDAEKAAAHRARNAVVDCRLPADTLATIDRIAAELGQPRTEVMHSMLKFALCNRDWARFGLYGKPLPHANDAPAAEAELAVEEAA